MDHVENQGLEVCRMKAPGLCGNVGVVRLLYFCYCPFLGSFYKPPLVDRIWLWGYTIMRSLPLILFTSELLRTRSLSKQSQPLSKIHKPRPTRLKQFCVVRFRIWSEGLGGLCANHTEAPRSDHFMGEDRCLTSQTQDRALERALETKPCFLSL